MRVLYIGQSTGHRTIEEFNKIWCDSNNYYIACQTIGGHIVYFTNPDPIKVSCEREIVEGFAKGGLDLTTWNNYVK